MGQMTFGMVLKEARERKGYDLSTAARRLRIRPDILRAIEETDFSRMPPRGYTRNMVNAYARLIGLNPTEITRMYLDEAYAYQVGRARNEIKPTGFDMGNSPRANRERRVSRHDESDAGSTRHNALGRALYDDRKDYGQRSNDSSQGRLYPEGRTHTTRHSALPTSQYTNFYAGPKAPSGVQSKLPFIIGGAVILVLLILVISLAFGNRAPSAESAPKVPVTGLTDTTVDENGDTSGEEPVKPVEIAPTSVAVVYELASGKEAYVITTNDGATEEKMLTGPVKETVEVKGVWSIATWVGDLTVTVNGAKVAFDSTNSNGIPLCTVDFATYLEKWKTEHPDSAGVASTAEGATPSTSSAVSNSSGTAA